MMTEHMWWPRYCPKCGGEMREYIVQLFDGPFYTCMRCSTCGHEEKVSE